MSNQTVISSRVDMRGLQYIQEYGQSTIKGIQYIAWCDEYIGTAWNGPNDGPTVVKQGIRGQWELFNA